MSSNPYYQKQAAATRRIQIVKSVKSVEGEDHEYQMQRHLVGWVHAYVRANLEEIIDLLRKDGHIRRDGDGFVVK